MVNVGKYTGPMDGMGMFASQTVLGKSVEVYKDHGNRAKEWIYKETKFEHQLVRCVCFFLGGEKKMIPKWHAFLQCQTLSGN